MTPSQLLERTYTCAQIASDRLSDALTAMENAGTEGPKAETRVLQALWPEILRELRRALASAEGLERRLAGVPGKEER